jgi:hypothetical protein
MLCAGIPDPSFSCNVPVFRYAMERWQADQYRIVVYHGAGERGAAFEALRQRLAGKKAAANYSLETVDVTTAEGKSAAGGRDFEALPWVEVHYPVQARTAQPVWSGRLTADGARGILGSPARSRLAEKLLAGDVAVWILMRSGHQEKDGRAREALRTSLERASATLRIPETGADANGNPIEVSDFKTYPVRFGMLEIARNDPQEALLVNALLKSEPDLEGYDEPLAFPVFGRGRALFALVGKGIQEKNIREACASMLAWCSCEIKAQNPGTDLMVAADWTRPFGGRMVKDPEVPLTGVSSFLGARKPEAVAAPKPAEQPDAPALCKLERPARGGAGSTEVPTPGRSPLLRNVLYLAGGVGTALLALSVFLTVRTRR